MCIRHNDEQWLKTEKIKEYDDLMSLEAEQFRYVILGSLYKI